MNRETKTDALKSVVNDELERRRKEIDAGYCDGHTTVAIIVRLRQGKPVKINFKTESESLIS